MKKTLLPLLVAAFAVFLSQPAQAATITLSLLTPAVAGSTFDVAVDATGVFDPPHDSDGLLGFGFDVSTTGPISYLSFTPGSLFTEVSTSAQVSALATSVFLFPGDFTEPLRLAVLSFSAASAGPATIFISSSVDNLDTGLVYLSAIDQLASRSEFSVDAQIPEPSTWSLMLLGGAAALAAKIRRPRA